MIIGQLIPDWLEGAGAEVSRLWPIVILLTAVVGSIWRGYHLLKKTITETVEPILALANDTNTTKFEHLEVRLVNIETQLFPNGGSSLRDKIDYISKQITMIEARSAETGVMASLLFEIDKCAMYRTDARGKVIACNRSYLDLWGVSSLIELQSFDWLGAAANAKSVEYSFTVIIEEQKEFMYNLELNDGRKLRVIGNPIIDPLGFSGFVGYIYPIHQLELEE